MTVLEPSAGKGDIAEAVQEAGAEVETFETQSRLRDILNAKGIYVRGHDFMDMQPREAFTFGDTFRAPDGYEGIMRGLGGMATHFLTDDLSAIDMGKINAALANSEGK